MKTMVMDIMGEEKETLMKKNGRDDVDGGVYHRHRSLERERERLGFRKKEMRLGFEFDEKEARV